MDFTPRRVVLFLLTSSLVLVSWYFFALPLYKLDPKQETASTESQEPENSTEESNDQQASPTDGSDQKPSPDKEPGAKGPSDQTGEQPKENIDDPDNVAKANPEKPPKAPVDSENSKELVTATLGSLDPDGEYYFLATLTSKGASVERLELNDRRYRDLDDPEKPLSLLQTVPNEELAPGPYYRTFATTFFEWTEDKNQKTVRETLLRDDANWTLLSKDENHVTFQYVVAGKYRFKKEFSLALPEDENNDSGETPDQQRDSNAQGYFLKLKISIENLQKSDTQVQYEMLGPVGLPLEDAESTSKFRDIKIGSLDDGTLEHRTLTVKDLAKSVEKNEPDGPPYAYEEEWGAPFRYVGVDGQFFTTLLYNSPDNPPTTKKVKNYTAEIVDLDQEQPTHSEVSILFTSNLIDLKEGGEQTDNYTLYSGPKRQGLLTKIEADKIIEFGWFGWISKSLLAILSFLHHNLALPYGLAIVCLTILVRGALFPLSKKQAHSAARMKELQPKLQELKKKYGDDKQKFAEAQMKLFRESGYNPFAGCLPMVLQLPIFIGLYGAIRHAIDLRAATFLWVDNLAAPDHLFHLPFRLPWVGNYFNLLPILTVGLFLAQQKMFMPKPDPDDEQAVMQQKMMNFMMIFMGFLFYHMPAGLCIYFIASSLWGMGERKLLDLGKQQDANGEDGKNAANAGATKSTPQNGREKRTNPASKKQGKKSKSRR